MLRRRVLRSHPYVQILERGIQWSNISVGHRVGSILLPRCAQARLCHDPLVGCKVNLVDDNQH